MMFAEENESRDLYDYDMISFKNLNNFQVIKSGLENLTLEKENCAKD